MRTALEAYARLYRAYVNELYSYGLSLGYGESMCMDAIHDVFCKMVVAGKDLSDIDNIKFYLLRSVKNRLLDIHHHGRKMDYDDLIGQGFRADVTLADDSMVEGEEREQLVARVKALMDELTDTQREAIYLRYIQEMEYDHIAELLNITPESARKLVYRGLEKLRQQNANVMGFVIFVQLLSACQQT